MRTLTFIIVLCAMLFISAINCTKDEPTKPTAPQNVIGTWNITVTSGQSSSSFRMTLKSDYSYSSNISQDGTFNSNGKTISWMLNNIYYSGTITGTDMSGTLASGNFIGKKMD